MGNTPQAKERTIVHLRSVRVAWTKYKDPCTFVGGKRYWRNPDLTGCSLGKMLLLILPETRRRC